MSKPNVKTDLNTFDRPECFEFWYGANYQTTMDQSKFPTYRQTLFIMALISNLQAPLKRYGVQYPYVNSKTKQFLLTPKKKFFQLAKFEAVQSLIEHLIELPNKLERYKAEPTVQSYLDLDVSLKKLLTYFSIPQQKAVLAKIKSKVPAKAWKAYEQEQQQIREKEAQLKQLEQWKQEQVRQLKTDCQPLTIGESLMDSVRRFKNRAEEGTRFISVNQKHKLTRLYYEGLLWLCVLNPSVDLNDRVHSDDYMEFLTFGEAGVLIDTLERLVSIFEREAVLKQKEPLLIELKTENFLTQNVIRVLKALGTYLPYFHELTQSLTVVAPGAGDVFQDAKVKKIQGYLQQMQQKLEDFSGVKGFKGIEGFTCGSDELYCCLEMDRFLTDKLKQALKKGETPRLEPMAYDDLIFFINESEIFKNIQIECDDFKFFDDWRFLMCEDYDSQLYRYLTQMNEILFNERGHKERQTLLFEQMMDTLKNLPMAKVCD